MNSHPATWNSLAPAETTTCRSGGMLCPACACSDCKGCATVSELAQRKPPAIKAKAATGTSHADHEDQVLLRTRVCCANLRSSRRPKPAGTSIMRSSAYSWITLRVPSNTDVHRLQVRKC